MADLYEIFLFQPDVPVGSEPTAIILQNWEYVEFVQRLNAPWSHVIRLKESLDNEQIQYIRDNVGRDWLVEIYRTDPITKIKTRVYDGFNRTLVLQTTGSGAVQTSLYGSGFTDLLRRRIVLPAANSDILSKSGIAETVIKEFIDETCVSSSDADRNFSGLSIEADQGWGGLVSYSARYTNLFTVVSNCAEDGGLDFGIIRGTSLRTFIFKVAKLWGTDRRDENFDGNTPVIFDFNFDNMIIPISSDNTSEERTVAYVGGAGSGNARLVVEVEDLATVDQSPWNRHETFLDARLLETERELENVGRVYVQNNRGKQSLTFNINQAPGSRWITDWNLGDLVTAKFLDIVSQKKIVGVRVVVTAEGGGGGVASQREFVAPDMEDAVVDWRLEVVGHSELQETTILGV